ncbi:MAG TPA: TraM recognition domain-containing protein [Acidimicrobiales bacterium]|nr:TraM recognition domain-containing protein [Acidimicrobiales bacterium]
MSRPATPKGHEDLALWAIAVSVAAAALCWLGGAAAIAVSGHSVPSGRELAGLEALAHPAHPGRAWGVAVGPTVLYWSLTVLVWATAGALAWGAWRAWRALGTIGQGARADDPRRRAGLASRRQVTLAAGPKALLAKAKVLRPSLSRPRAADVGIALGRSQGVQCWSGARDSIVILGPPGAGKGLHLVIPTILDAPGPVITTSTRPDNLAVTLAARTRRGPVAVFDPQGLAPGVPSATRWSPVRGCEAPRVAMARAVALVGEAGAGTENDTFWTAQTTRATQCLLHAAALAGRPPLDLYRWSLSPASAKEAVEILREDRRAGLAWSRALDAIVTAEARTRDPTWAMVSNTFAALADPAVLDAVSPGPDEVFEPAKFLASDGAVFLLGTAAGASATARLVSAFVEDVVETARRLAAASVGARLDPPLSLVLDEAANYPLPSLPALMSEGGGTGITTVVVLQSLAQARSRWGSESAQAIWDSATVKVVLGGQGSADDLADMSRLLGEVEVAETTQSHSRRGEGSVTVSTRSRPILTPAQLRELPFGLGVLILRSAPPIMLALSPWTTRRDAAVLEADKARLEATVAAAVAGGLDA